MALLHPVHLFVLENREGRPEAQSFQLVFSGALALHGGPSGLAWLGEEGAGLPSVEWGTHQLDPLHSSYIRSSCTATLLLYMLFWVRFGLERRV